VGCVEILRVLLKLAVIVVLLQVLALAQVVVLLEVEHFVEMVHAMVEKVAHRVPQIVEYVRHFVVMEAAMVQKHVIPVLEIAEPVLHQALIYKVIQRQSDCLLTIRLIGHLPMQLRVLLLGFGQEQDLPAEVNQEVFLMPR
jgi:hypothetical protein